MSARILVVSFLSFLCFELYGQRTQLTSKDLETWPLVQPIGVANSGNYVAYSIDDPKSRTKTLVIKGAKGKWEKRIIGGRNVKFASNSRFVFYVIADSLYGINLLNKTDYKYGAVSNYLLIGSKSFSRLLCQANSSKQVRLIDTDGDTLRLFKNIEQFIVGPGNKSVILKVMYDSVKRSENGFIYLNLESLSTKAIKFDKEISSLVFNKQGNMAAFVSQPRHWKSESFQIYKYKLGEDVVEELKVSESSKNSQFNLENLHEIRFSGDSRNLILDIGINVNKKKKDTSNPIVWSYNDVEIQSVKSFSTVESYIYGINLEDGYIRRLVGQDEMKISFFLGSDQYWDGEFIIVEHRQYIQFVNSRGQNFFFIYYIVNISSGERIELTRAQRKVPFFTISPSQIWVIYFDPEKANYFSYNLKTHEVADLTSKMGQNWGNYTRHDVINPNTIPISTALWYGDHIVLNDRFNLWQFDPSGKIAAQCLTPQTTNVDLTVYSPALGPKQIISTDRRTLLVMGFNTRTKKQSYYEVALSGTPSVKKIFEGAYIFNGPSDYAYAGTVSTYSENKKFFLITRQSSREFPNVFLTSNFSQFIGISNLAPQGNFYWHNKELHTWTGGDGRSIDGILYKPDDFQPDKKYPVIFYTYEKMSQKLNVFDMPEHAHSTLAPAYLVANGFLVFCPDVNFKNSAPGDSYISSIEAAVNYLSRLPYIDTSRLGLQGHSMGGYGANYVISHSDKFKAMISSAGASNLTSLYTGLWKFSGISKMGDLELGQFRMAGTLWEYPTEYVLNSPVFNANNVKAAVLLLHNKEDGAVEYAQGLGFFLALRRLNKPSWLLEYSGEDHSLTRTSNVLDFEEKALSFFNFYLNGGQKPAWMK
jgi:dipeptidyl aminopeptidase/acylaminoacyl peptidase